jgi:hypothetical protein
MTNVKHERTNRKQRQNKEFISVFHRKKTAEFVNVFIQSNGNIKIACKKAGIARNTAASILQDPLIKQSISRVNKENMDGLIKMSLEFKHEKLKGIVESNYGIKDDVVIRAIEADNKMQGHLAPEKIININLEGKIGEIGELLTKFEKDF